MKILVADNIHEAGLQALEALGCQVESQPELKGEALASALGSLEPEILIVRSTVVTEAMLDISPRLSLIVRAGAGTNTIAVSEAAGRGIYVANCPGKNAIAVAELAFGLMLSADRQIPNGTRDLRAGTWNKKKYATGRGLYGRTLGLLGLGRIGCAMIPRARAFGMPVVAWSRSLTAEKADELGVDRRDSPLEVARTSDFLSVHVALTPETEHLVDEELLRALPEGAVFVNTSRGGVVDEAALRRVMEEKDLTCALDVFEEEPAAKTGSFDNPLTERERFIGTHHIGASTEQAQYAVAMEAVRVIRSYRSEGVVPNCINLCKQSPATHLLVVRHLDRVGVLAGVFDALRAADINVQETENVIFDGAEAAVARIRLEEPPSPEVLETIQASLNVLAATLIPLT